MVNKCVVSSCDTMKSGDDVTMFGLPVDPGVRMAWINALKMETGQAIFRDDDLICSKHFAPECFVTIEGSLVLNSDAIPFKNLPANVEMQTSVKRPPAEEETGRSRPRSIVWEYFRRINDISATCELCNKELKYFGRTSNLRGHMRRVHPVQFDADFSIGREVWTNPDSSGSPHPSNSIDLGRSDVKEPMNKSILSKSSLPREKEDLDEALLNLIVMDHQPPGIVEEPGFVAYSKRLNPQYILPSESVLLSEMLPKFFDKVHSQLWQIIGDVAHIALSADIWATSNKEVFFTLTGHFIYTEEIHHRVLATKELPEYCTVEHLAHVLTTLLNEWQIHRKVTCIVTDGGTLIKEAVVDKLKLHHHLCIGSFLNTCIGIALRDNKVVNLLKKCRQIVSFLEKNPPLMETVSHAKEPMQHLRMNVNQNDPFRWRFSLTILENFFYRRETLSEVLSAAKQAPELLTKPEWNIIGDLIVLLKPAENLVEELCSVKYQTISLIIPIIRGLQLTVKTKQLLTDVGKSVQETLLETISETFDALESDPILSKATFLDPRFKTACFSSPNLAELVRKDIINELSTMLAANEGKTRSTEPPGSIDANDIWAHFDQKVAQLKSSTTPLSNAELMLSQYLQAPMIERTQSPFSFCAQNKNLFPDLYKLQLKYCCGAATCIPAKRLFTSEGRSVVERRSRLPLYIIDEIIFLNGNLSLGDK